MPTEGKVACKREQNLPGRVMFYGMWCFLAKDLADSKSAAKSIGFSPRLVQVGFYSERRKDDVNQPRWDPAGTAHVPSTRRVRDTCMLPRILGFDNMSSVSQSSRSMRHSALPYIISLLSPPSPTTRT